MNGGACGLRQDAASTNYIARGNCVKKVLLVVFLRVLTTLFSFFEPKYLFWSQQLLADWLQNGGGEQLHKDHNTLDRVLISIAACVLLCC